MEGKNYFSCYFKLPYVPEIRQTLKKVILEAQVSNHHFQTSDSGQLVIEQCYLCCTSSFPIYSVASTH